jgi:serine phosphatase RsbU (regulator of sigma subunit)
VLATGEPVLNAEIVVHGRRCEASFFGIRAGEDDPVAVGMAVTDIEGRRRAEDARERLQHATATLAATVTVTDVAEAAVAEARDTFDSDGAALMLRRGDWLQPVAIGGLTPEKHGRLAQVAVSARRPVAVAVRTGRPVYVRSPAEMAERFPQLSDVPALAALPLVTTGEPIGALLIDFTRPRALDAGERALLSALATQCAIALNRAQLFERERDISQTLQASLLPRELPRIPGLDLAAELQAGTQGLDVGGDFYDAFAIGPGAWGIAIGDVCGKGVDAAALTALARHTVRAAAMGGASPGEVLLALNRAVLSEGRLGQFLTGIYARLRARPDGAFAVTLACGGHPPPVVLRADGAAGPLECSGTLLGVLEDPHLEESEAILAPGDTLMLYTDGMTEAAAPERTMSAAEVADLLRAARASRARDTASDALAAVARMAGGALRDDVAVLVAQALSTEGRTAAGESSTRGQ